jgi:hypothetical protein
MHSQKISFVKVFLLAGTLSLWLSLVATAGTGDPNQEVTAQPMGALTTHAEVTVQTLPTVAGMMYYSVSYADFVPYSDSTAKQVSPGAGAYATGGSLVAKIDLPHGSFVYDVTVWGGAGGWVNLRRANQGVYTWDTLADIALPAGTGIISTTFVLPSPVRVDTGQASYHLQIFSTTSATAILSARIGYRMDTGAFYSIQSKTGEGTVIYLD